VRGKEVQQPSGDIAVGAFSLPGAYAPALLGAPTIANPLDMG
jgi:hypothetical protein